MGKKNAAAFDVGGSDLVTGFLLRPQSWNRLLAFAIRTWCVESRGAGKKKGKHTALDSSLCFGVFKQQLNFGCALVLL